MYPPQRGPRRLRELCTNGFTQRKKIPDVVLACSHGCNKIQHTGSIPFHSGWSLTRHQEACLGRGARKLLTGAAYPAERRQSRSNIRWPLRRTIFHKPVIPSSQREQNATT